MAKAMIGLIGGSGVYDIDGLQGAEWVDVETPWGKPSDAILRGTLDGVEMAFLPRHGRGHIQTPTSINYRANIDALKRIGVTDVISVSACGSFREEMAPGHFVIVDQFIDRTFGREKSFFGPGCVGHVSVAHPVCARLGDALMDACKPTGITAHRGGTYLAMEGPQFSSLAESKMYREVWACDVIGMTNMPEAKLAREEMAPGHFVIVDQFIDRTFGREKSFFGPGCVGHVSVAHPVCARLGDALMDACKSTGITAHRGGTYLAMEGPQFSSLAESKMYREVWACDVIGMTNMPEAKLAREAELCYATVAMVTDYDSWHPDHGEVDVTSIIQILTGNSANAKSLIAQVAPALGGTRDVCAGGCDRALEFAIMTGPDGRDPALVAKLDAVAGRVLG